MIDIGKQKISNNCPACGKVYTVTIKQVADQATVKCLCGQQIQLRDSGGSAKKAVRDINKAALDLERAFKRLGR
jgi:transcription elongation factor Elf1